MKIRLGFVSNSSSASSFFFIAAKEPLTKNNLKEKILKWFGKQSSRTNGNAFSDEIADNCVEELLNYRGKCDSEDELIERADDDLMFEHSEKWFPVAPPEILGKGFKHFYFGLKGGLIDKYYLKIDDDDFFLGSYMKEGCDHIFFKDVEGSEKIQEELEQEQKLLENSVIQEKIRQFLEDFLKHDNIRGILIMTKTGQVISTTLKREKLKRISDENYLKKMKFGDTILKAYFLSKDGDLVFAERFNDSYFLILLLDPFIKFGLAGAYVSKIIYHITENVMKDPKDEPGKMGQNIKLQTSDGMIEVKGTIKGETEKTLLIAFSIRGGQEALIPKWAVRSQYDAASRNEQAFMIDTWILERNKIVSAHGIFTKSKYEPEVVIPSKLDDTIAGKHDYSFIGADTAFLLSSDLESEPHITIGCIKKQYDELWEKPSSVEGEEVQLSLEEIALLLQVLNRQSMNFTTYHGTYRKKQISFNWEDRYAENLWITIGRFPKMLNSAQAEIFRRLLERWLDVKIQQINSFTGSSQND